jgi:hypothetical protein
MAAPFGGRAPAMTVFGPLRYTSRRTASGRYDAIIAVFDAIITFQPTEPSWRASSSIACKTVSSATSAPPTAVGTDMLKIPASRRASNNRRGTCRSCSPASRHFSTTGARARARSTHSFVLIAMFVVKDATPFCLYTPQPEHVSCSRQGSYASIVPFALLQPNATLQPLPEAGAQRTLEGVACTPWFGAGSGTDMGFPPTS